MMNVKVGQGTLFSNRNKSKLNSPEYLGKINIGDKMFNVGGWANMSANGPYISLIINEVSIEIFKQRKRTKRNELSGNMQNQS